MTMFFLLFFFFFAIQAVARKERNEVIFKEAKGQIKLIHVSLLRWNKIH